METATRSLSSTSIGEVQQRAHSQGESDDHFEVGFTDVSNRNRCHAVTYYFYRIIECQTLCSSS